MQLVFADSEVAAVEVHADTLRMRFAAAAVEAGPGGEAGYLSGLVLVFEHAQWRGDPAACFGRLLEGTLSDAVSRFTRIALPFDGPGPWRAEFGFAHGQQLVVQARRVLAQPAADQAFRPAYAC